jgi:hypothetical protein
MVSISYHIRTRDDLELGLFVLQVIIIRDEVNIVHQFDTRMTRSLDK